MAAAGLMRIEVCGSVLVQDLGRPDAVSWGVPSSGAADRGALRRANRLVGNPEDAAALEIFGGVRAVMLHSAVVAISGADVDVDVDGRGAATECAVDVPAGAVISMSPARRGLRSYFAVRGGIAAQMTLGSRSYDALSGLGPSPLRAGDVVDAGAVVPVDAPWRERLPVSVGVPRDVRIAPGPQVGWIDTGALVSAPWTVSATSNRVGLRLRGAPLRRPAGEVDPIPVMPGAIQVPPDGLPIVLGPDAGVTGGYPVVACVVDDLDALGQLAPGESLHLRWA